MMCNNPKIDFVNINVYTKFGKMLSLVLKVLNRNKIITDVIMDGQKDRMMDNPAIIKSYLGCKVNHDLL